jgi:hypothetical protein
LCTKCTCKATSKRGFYQLSRYESEHEKNWKAKQADGNLTKIEDDPTAAIPLGPHVVTTYERGGDPEDDDDMTLTGALFTPVLDVDNEDDGMYPVAY